MIVRKRARLGALAVAAVTVIGLVAACGDDDSGSGSETSGGGDGGKVTLAAYSTPQEAYEEIIPAFNETPDGEGVSFEQSYASSGESRRAVQEGLPADVVALSLAPDVTALVEDGLVPETWDQDEYDGMVTDSVVVLVTRKDNPKGIDGWEDLTADGIEVITPNPFTSGGAKWNIMAAYGAQVEQGKSEDEAIQYISDLFENVPVQNKSAREALQTFVAGKGDVLISYENEAITAQQAGEDIEYVIPDETILIENPIAVTTLGEDNAAAGAFVEFTRSDAAQTIFGEKGYRPVVPSVAAEFDYPEPADLFTIDDLGGWETVNDEFFDAENGVIAGVFEKQGIATE